LPEGSPCISIDGRICEKSEGSLSTGCPWITNQ
jgi:hypothetical protein